MPGTTITWERGISSRREKTGLCCVTRWRQPGTTELHTQTCMREIQVTVNLVSLPYALSRSRAPSETRERMTRQTSASPTPQMTMQESTDRPHRNRAHRNGQSGIRVRARARDYKPMPRHGARSARLNWLTIRRQCIPTTWNHTNTSHLSRCRRLSRTSQPGMN